MVERRREFPQRERRIKVAIQDHNMLRWGRQRTNRETALEEIEQFGDSAQFGRLLGELDELTIYPLTNKDTRQRMVELLGELVESVGGEDNPTKLYRAWKLAQPRRETIRTQQELERRRHLHVYKRPTERFPEGRLFIDVNDSTFLFYETHLRILRALDRTPKTRAQYLEAVSGKRAEELTLEEKAKITAAQSSLSHHTRINFPGGSNEIAERGYCLPPEYDVTYDANVFDD